MHVCACVGICICICTCTCACTCARIITCTCRCRCICAFVGACAAAPVPLLAYTTKSYHGFTYTRNEAVLHTDINFMPRRRRAWAAWNYRMGTDESALVPVTYDMNALQGLDAPERFLVTLNPNEPIAPGRVLRRIWFCRSTQEQSGTRGVPFLAAGTDLWSFCLADS